jgi:ATP-binding cassette, subfamily B, bacterial
MKAPSHTDLALYRRILADARPFWGHLAAIFFLSLLSTPLALLVPVPLQLVVDSVIGSRPLQHWVGALLPGRLATSPEWLLAIAASLLVVVTVLQQLEGFASWVLQLATGERLVLAARARLFQHVQRLSLLYHGTRDLADPLYRIQHDAPAVQYMLVGGLVPLATSVAMLAGMMYVTARIDGELALVALLVSPALLALGSVYRRGARDRWAEVKESETAALAVVQETLASIRVVKAFGQEDRESDRFVRKATTAMAEQLRLVFAETRFGLLVALTLAAGTAAVLLVGTRHVRAGTLTLGSLLLVMAYLAQLYRPLETISKKLGTIQAALASAQRVFAIHDESPDVVDRVGAHPLGRAAGHVTLRDVSFAYGDGRRVLEHVSLDVPAGTSVGIAGPTGAGKTTLLSLLARLFDPISGQVLLDGTDLRDYRLRDLRDQFAVVLQEPVLFSTTVGENIAYGRPGASRAEIVAAAHAAGAHDFIRALPAGYDTAVGDRGMTLSGGERQRICLARAFLKDAPILILDEPTSAVDMQSEAIILAAMQRLMQGRTTFMVAHRVHTLDICDLRLVIDGSRVLPSDAVSVQPVTQPAVAVPA